MTVTMPRGLLQAGVICLCSSWFHSSSPSGVGAFLSPSAGLRTHSCSGKMPRRGAKRSCVAITRYRACAMVSSETTTKLLQQRTTRDRVARTKQSDFVVYTGPTGDHSRKLSPQQKARKEKEQLLGKRIRRCAQLQKLKKQLFEKTGGETVTDELWAQAAGETEESLRRFLDDGASAKQALVEMNLGVVYNIVDGYLQSMKYGGESGGQTVFAKKDLVQEATMGLIYAVERFDPSRGFRFATYAQWWVRKYLNECLQNHNRMIRIPIALAYRISKVNRLKDQLRMELGRAPTKQELASEAGCTLEQLNACFEHGALSVSSLDHISGFGRVKAGENIRSIEGYITNEMSFFSPPLQSQTQLQVLPHQHSQPQSSRGLGGDAGAGAKSLLGTGAEFMQVSLREDLKDALFRLLDATERQCLVLRYGLQDGVPKSVEETAEIMEFSDPDDVRIITRQAMVKLREGCLPQEKEKLMSYLSRYEPETLVGTKTGGDARGRQNGSSKISTTNSIAKSERSKSSRMGSALCTNSAKTGDDNKEMYNDEDILAVDAEEEEGVVWDFSNHGQEELQAELNRYLKKLRLEKDEEEHKGTKWSKRALAKGGSRRKRNGTISKYQQEASRRREERLRKLERDRRAEEQQRKMEAEWERKRMLKPMRVGSGAGSAVIGDLEPKPDSREASQLEHLSRLLWDGEEEPAEFALSYGRQSERPSIQ